MAKTEGANKRRGLGRGLGALIVNTQENAAGDETQAENGVRTLAIDAISPNPHQPRSQFDAQALAELADSIRTHGVIQPLIVTLAPEQDAETPHYWIVAGERRWRAARSAGLREVPAIVREASTRQLMEWALVENVQRADLNPLEEAVAYQALMTEFHLTQAEVAKRVGKSRSAIANTVRLQQLPPAAQDALLNNRISAGHARALLALPDAESMQKALELILEQDLSVRQTEALIKELLQPEPSPGRTPQSPPDEETSAVHEQLRYLENRFRSALSTRVTLNRNDDGSGRLVVHFYSDEDLENLIRHITGEAPD